MHELRKKIDEAVAVIRQRTADRPPPEVGIVLGTGLGQLGEEIGDALVIPYPEIPHFPVSTVESHAGSLLRGRLEGEEVLAMQGRFHQYEGYSASEITFGVRVMKEMGVDKMFISNACGGMNPTYEIGDLMIIDDHINLMGCNPLTGLNDATFGDRFPDMSAPYDHELSHIALEIAGREGFRCHEGVYVAVSGPCLETRAEYRFLRGIGADVVGMSTVPEVIVAAQCGLRVLGISIVTDRCIPETLEPVDIDKIIAAAAEAEPRLTTVFRKTLAQLAQQASPGVDATDDSTPAPGSGPLG